MIRWGEVTWYSKLGAIALFFGVVPVLSFYLGMQYQSVIDLNERLAEAPLSPVAAGVAPDVGELMPPDVLSVADLKNTRWVPDTEQDAVLSFDSTLENDPNKRFFDYTAASDSQVREYGYWEVRDNAMLLTPTQIVTYPVHIEKITKVTYPKQLTDAPDSAPTLHVYFQGETEPASFVRWEQ